MAWDAARPVCAACSEVLPFLYTVRRFPRSFGSPSFADLQSGLPAGSPVTAAVGTSFAALSDGGGSIAVADRLGSRSHKRRLRAVHWLSDATSV